MLLAVQEIGTLPNIEEMEKKKEIVKDVVIRLSEFVQKNPISQRKFRKKYDVDITRLRSWISGQRGMSLEMIGKIENILSSGPVTA